LFEYVNNLVRKKKSKRHIREDIVVLRPVKKNYSTDNAAMIGVVGILNKL
jgi:tRNA A37 threonylcarbamoyltransferase TsaD